eukprot:14590827-Heterocapsa_arctica.AAC.1
MPVWAPGAGWRVATQAMARADERVLPPAALEPTLPRRSSSPRTPRQGSRAQRLLHRRADRRDRRC